MVYFTFYIPAGFLFFFLFKLINLFLLYPYGCMSARGKVISVLGLGLPGDVLLIASLTSCFSVQVDLYCEAVLTVPNFSGFLRELLLIVGEQSLASIRGFK